MTKHQRLIRELIARYGFRLVSMQCKTHYKARLLRADGTEVTCIFPKTPSDARWVMNKEAQLRSLASGQETKSHDAH